MKKTVTFELPAVSVEIEVKEDLSKDQIRKLGEKEVVKQLSKKFPIYRWSLIDGAVISDEDVVCGRPVKLKSSGEIGIIYEVQHGTKFPIRLLVNGENDMQCTPSAIEKVSKRTKVEKLIKGRPEWAKSSGQWLGVRTAFFVNGEEIIPVIVHVPNRGKTKAYIVGHEVKGSFYTITPSNMNRLFDSKEDAESYLARSI